MSKGIEIPRINTFKGNLPKVLNSPFTQFGMGAQGKLEDQGFPICLDSKVFYCTSER